MFQRALQSVNEVVSAGIQQARYLCGEGCLEGFDSKVAAGKLFTVANAMVEHGPEGMQEHAGRLFKAVTEKNWRLALDTLIDSARHAQRTSLSGFELPISEGHYDFSAVNAPAGFRS